MISLILFKTDLSNGSSSHIMRVTTLVLLILFVADLYYYYVFI